MKIAKVISIYKCKKKKKNGQLQAYFLITVYFENY